MHIVNETLNKNEQVKILKMMEKSTFDSQENFADIKDDYDNISEIEAKMSVDCSKLFVINVNLMAKGKEKYHDSM